MKRIVEKRKMREAKEMQKMLETEKVISQEVIAEVKELGEAVIAYGKEHGRETHLFVTKSAENAIIIDYEKEQVGISVNAFEYIQKYEKSFLKDILREWENIEDLIEENISDIQEASVEAVAEDDADEETDQKSMMASNIAMKSGDIFAVPVVDDEVVASKPTDKDLINMLRSGATIADLRKIEPLFVEVGMVIDESVDADIQLCALFEARRARKEEFSETILD